MKHLYSALCFCILLPALMACSSGKKSAASNQVLWYPYPGEYWNSQGLHLGNGYFGASFLGGVEEETIFITDASMWTGGPARGDWERAGVNPKARESLPAIREAVVNGEIRLADSLVTQDFLGNSDLYGYFTSIGALKIGFPSDQPAYSGYRRELDLSNSLGRIQYEKDGVRYSREYFCSYPDKILVLKYDSDREGALDLELGISVIQDSSRVIISGNEFHLKGFINGNERPFDVLIKVVNHGGTFGRSGQLLTLRNATSAKLYITMSTDYQMEYPEYVGEDPEVKNRDVLESAMQKAYEELKRRHIEDYRSLYDRVSLELDQDPELAKLPTNERFERLKAGGTDPGYKELAFNLGRYMVISSSRPGTLPANLQGVWNVFDFAPWAGNYQSNINIQEIYWSCGPLNLPECQQAYIDWIENLSISGAEIARRVYGSDGWISHTIGNIYGHAAPTGGLVWGMYPMGSAWHCQHVWDQYAFTKDINYLKNQAYPMLKGASQFWLENLIPFQGYYITAPTVSAEHGALMTEDGLNPAFHDFRSDQYRYNIPGVYQDMEMLWDLFTNTAEAAAILGELSFADTLIKAREKLLPLKIGKYGQLQEWYEDIDDPDCHHRHIAHLYAVAPGRQIHPTTTPELAEAAKKSLNMRGDGRYMEQEVAAGGNWSRAHRMWAWTRLLDGERANKIMTETLTEQGFENGLSYQHAPYNGTGGPEVYTEPDGMYCNWQLDASGALPGCIAEMVVQSHMGEIHLLPALPQEFKTGRLTGIQARGGYGIDIEWKESDLVKAVIRGQSGEIPKIRLKDHLVDLSADDRIEFVW
jgi:alpha-L-fucosidase 2